jgi:hypothetical protein
MSSVLAKILPKRLVIREEDYWIIFVSCFNVIFITAAIYASVPTYRVPVTLLALAGVWFTTSKVNKGYGPVNARLHLLSLLVAGALLFWAVYALTN